MQLFEHSEVAESTLTFATELNQTCIYAASQNNKNKPPGRIPVFSIAPNNLQYTANAAPKERN
jgi:hypothetical protein